ncbi:hypothetical protein CBER1_09205 [Cercospora berteroae]|uniref:NAD-dependent epimerase/dehydratase domain-containing protein n=1 Tax=Cercospora berteroae TaxID=357750 RepID=A0A2S6BVN2_9PEZI|nr:hypothetical protein CBER1_09205 [Cercospora berteroae]
MVALTIMPPKIFGTGTGIFNTRSVQVPAYVNAALKNGKAVMVGTGQAQLDHVHVEDLAELYALVLVDFIENGGRKLPRGKEAVIFAENGRHSWGEVAQGIADAGFEKGVLGSREVESVSLAEGARLFAGGLIPEGNEELIEVSLSSNGLTKARFAREGLGWRPRRGQEEWARGLRDEMERSIETRW